MGLRRLVRCAFVFVLMLSLALTVAPTVAPDPAAATGESDFLSPPSLPSPAEIGRPDSVDGIGFGDPTAEVDVIAPPTPNASGSARLSYPLDLPQGRGMSSIATPDLALTYDSSARSGWVGQGWSFGASQISVDTTFGVPRFCPSPGPGPACGDVESEAYRLDGDLLWPNASVLDTPRITDRGDYVRKVEDTYQRIIRQGYRTRNYSWEVQDKEGNVSWYGAYPDRGGDPDSTGGPGTRTGKSRNDGSIARDAILADDNSNGYTWYVKAQRDIYANLVRYEYDTVHYKSRATDSGMVWDTVPESSCTPQVTCARHVYLSKIYYGGRTESAAGSGSAEAPTYLVKLLRTARVGDPVLDARGGFLDLDAEQLDKIEIRLLNDNPEGRPTSSADDYDGTLMKTYDLTYVTWS